jgi:hypothetical protein
MSSVTVTPNLACQDCVHCHKRPYESGTILWSCVRPVFHLVKGPGVLDRPCNLERTMRENHHTYGPDHKLCGPYGIFYEAKISGRRPHAGDFGGRK